MQPQVSFNFTQKLVSLIFVADNKHEIMFELTIRSFLVI